MPIGSPTLVVKCHKGCELERKSLLEASYKPERILELRSVAWLNTEVKMPVKTIKEFLTCEHLSSFS